MDNYSMIFKRKSFHVFLGAEQLSEGELAALQQFIDGVTPLDADIRTKITIVPKKQTNSKCGAEYCILFYSETKPDYLRNIGYIGEQIDLYCAAQNIGALWYGIGKTDEKQVDGLDYVIMMCIAKMPENKFRKDMFKAKRKELSAVWTGELADSVGNIARFAPSAVNSQPWSVHSADGEIAVSRYKKPGKSGIMTAAATLYFNQVDIGIYLFILEVCLQHEGKSFERTLYHDDADEAKEQTPVARYHLK